MIKVTAQRNVFGQLLFLTQENNIDLLKVMAYPLGPVPWSLATADGMPIKTNKAVLMHRLEEASSLKSPQSEFQIHVIDGNALFHTLTQLPDTFGEIAFHIFAALPKTTKIHFLTDNYKHTSIKSLERSRRGTSQAYTIAGPSTQIPKEWKTFLMNVRNKTQFIKFLLSEWRKDEYAEMLQGREIVFACDFECFLLSSEDGITTDATPLPNLASSQEEADTLIILHSLNADQKAANEDASIVIHSPDTDVFILLLAFCQKFCHPLYFDTGVGNKRRIIHIQSLCEKSIGIFWTPF